MHIINKEMAVDGEIKGQIDTPEGRKGLVEAFSAWMKGSDFPIPYSKHTTKAYRRCTDHFLDFAASQQIIDVSEISIPNIRLFIGKELQKLSVSTKDQYVSALDAMFDFFGIQGLVDVNPAKVFRSEIRQLRRGGRKAKRLPSFLYKNEIDTLIDTLFSRNHVNRMRDLAICSLILDSGLRTSEVAYLKVRDGIMLRDNGTLRVIGKGNKERIILPMDRYRKFVIEHLQANLDDDKELSDFLFTTRTGKPITQSLVYHVVSSSLKRAGIEKPQEGGHVLRHTASTMMVASGMSLRRVQENLGHERLDTTQIYVHLIDIME